MTKANPHIVHVIAGLETGGAEMMLLKLIAETAGRLRHSVISLSGPGTLGPRMEAVGGTVVAMELGGPFAALLALPRLARLLHRMKPDLVQGWMYHGNIAASLAAMLARADWPVAWAIRCTIQTFQEKLFTRILVRAGALLSRQPMAIFYNSRPAQAQHEAIGYARCGIVLGNGFEMDRFAPDPQLRGVVRARLGVTPDQLLVGYVGRLAPIKDLATFFAAMARLAAMRPDIAIVAMGRDLPRAHEMLPESQGDLAALGERLILLPEQTDINGFYQAFDVLVLSSLAEGFPNVIGEAMASGTPCVSTDVGDCPAIIADTGRLVPVQAPGAMAAAVKDVLDLPMAARQMLGANARARIAAHYSIGSIARAHEAEWLRLVAARHSGTA